jgi:hypothetical protein
MKKLFFLISLVFITIGASFAQLVRIEIKNEKYGLIDFKTKKPLTEFIYDDIEFVSNTGFLVMQNNKIGLLDKKAKKVFSCIYNEIYPVLDKPNYVVVENLKGILSAYSIKDKKFVFTNFTADMDNPVCGPYNEYTGAITKMIVVIQKNNKSGILELPSKILLPIDYKDIIICESKPGVLILNKADKYRFYNIKDQKLLTPEFELNGNYKELMDENGSCTVDGTDYFPAKVNGKWGLMNMYGKFKIPAKFEKLRSSSYTKAKNAFTVVYTQNKWFSYNYGKIKAFDIDYFLGFWYNYAVIIKNEKVLFYNTKGTRFNVIKLLKPTDTKLKSFQINGKSGVVSYKSQLILDFEFQDIEINGNLIFAKRNNKYALLNNEGKPLTAYKYDNISMGGRKERILITKQNGKYGLLSFEGSEIIKAKYTFISKFSNGKASAKFYKSAFEIDIKGNKIN